MKKMLLVAFAIAAFGLRAKEPPVEPFVAHEWGTFTSVAMNTGGPARWAPWIGPPDLPCFVHTKDIRYKESLRGLVRMETPVIYFYAKQPTTVSVHVDFPKGMISEWYPRAFMDSAGQAGFPAVPEGGSIEWKDVRLDPGASVALPNRQDGSHYYAARATDAVPLHVGDEQEKLLFYRGVGNFAPPLNAWYPEDGKLDLRNIDKDPIPVAIVFENQGTGKVGFRVIHDLKGSMAITPPEIAQDVATLQETLRRELVTAGLYKKEAAAMVETWRDSWFEPGTRVFYIMPRATVDRVLPLTITPTTANIARVFVGRVELLSPWTERTITEAGRKGDFVKLRLFGRFLGPFADMMNLANAPGIPQLREELSLDRRTASCVN